jgi:hypothetical protein
MTEPRPVSEDNPIGIDKARQGVVSYRIIWVLGVGTALAVLAMLALWLGIGVHSALK